MYILSRLNNRQLCAMSPTMCNKRAWIATAAMLAGSVASSALGGAKASQAAKKAARENRYRSNAEKAWYDKEYNTDYLDTKAGQNLLRRAQEVQDRYVRKVDGAAAVGGGTAASTAMAKESANKAIGDAVANIAAQDSARKQRVADTHLTNTQQLSRERSQVEQLKAANVTDAAQNMSNALAAGAVTRMGSQLGGANTLKKSKLDNEAPTLDNKNVTDIAEGHAYKTNAQGYINPATKDGRTMLDDAVGDLLKRKPTIPHVGG